MIVSSIQASGGNYGWYCDEYSLVVITFLAILVVFSDKLAVMEWEWWGDKKGGLLSHNGVLNELKCNLKTWLKAIFTSVVFNILPY